MKAHHTSDFEKLLDRAHEAHARGLAYAQHILRSTEIFRHPGPGPTKVRIDAAAKATTWDQLLVALESTTLNFAVSNGGKASHQLGGNDLETFLLETGRLLGDAEFMTAEVSRGDLDGHNELVGKLRGNLDLDPFDDFDSEEVFQNSIFSGTHSVGAITHDDTALRQDAAELLVQLKERLRSLQMLSDNDDAWISARLNRLMRKLGIRERKTALNRALLRNLHRQVRTSLQAQNPGADTIEQITGQLANLYFKSKADTGSLARRVRRAVSKAP